MNPCLDRGRGTWGSFVIFSEKSRQRHETIWAVNLSTQPLGMTNFPKCCLRKYPEQQKPAPSFSRAVGCAPSSLRVTLPRPRAASLCCGVGRLEWGVSPKGWAERPLWEVWRECRPPWGSRSVLGTWTGRREAGALSQSVLPCVISGLHLRTR